MCIRDSVIGGAGGHRVGGAGLGAGAGLQIERGEAGRGVGGVGEGGDRLYACLLYTSRCV